MNNTFIFSSLKKYFFLYLLFMIIILSSFSFKNNYQTFRCPIPASTNIFCKWMLVINTATWAKICQFDSVVSYQNIFWLDISVKNPIFVHVSYRFQELIHHHLYFLFLYSSFSAVYQFIQVHFHQFKNKSEAAIKQKQNKYISIKSLVVARVYIILQSL